MSPHIPAIRSIIEKRYAVKRRLRYTAVILLLISTAILTFSLATSLHGYLYYSLDIESLWFGLVQAGIWSAAFIAPAALLIIASTRLSNWLVPISPVRCPQCKNTTQHLVEPRCPECGLDLPKCLVTEAKKTPDQHPPIP